MYRFLVSRIKDYENVHAPAVRTAYGTLAGAVGLCSNLLICVAKIVTGLLAGSVAVVADGINNLSDAASSVVTLVGFRLAAAPGDEKHPYGHARIEYLTGLFIAIGIILIGFNILLASVDKCRHPDPIIFGYPMLAVLCLSVLVKVWQALFYVRAGKAIDSTALKTAGADSRNDVVATLIVIIGVLVYRFFGLNTDGILGCLLAIFIIVSGIGMIRETIDPLLGKAPDPALTAAIEKRIRETNGIIGMHDLAVHDYGPGRILASVHAEVDARADFMTCHDIIDNVEREIAEALSVDIVVHMDPVDTTDPDTARLREHMARVAEETAGVVGIHDLRIVRGTSHTNVVFDAVLGTDCKFSHEELTERFAGELTRVDASYRTVINFDADYGTAPSGKT